MFLYSLFQPTHLCTNCGNRISLRAYYCQYCGQAQIYEFCSIHRRTRTSLFGRKHHSYYEVSEVDRQGKWVSLKASKSFGHDSTERVLSSLCEMLERDGWRRHGGKNDLEPAHERQQWTLEKGRGTELATYRRIVDRYEPSEYDLKIDTQAEKYIERRHALLIFLVTAAVGSFAYTLNFAAGKWLMISAHQSTIWFLLSGGLCALIVAGSSLLSLFLNMDSYRLHLETRSNRKSFERLSEKDQRHWNRLNRATNVLQNLSIALLFVSIVLQGLVLLALLRWQPTSLPVV